MMAKSPIGESPREPSGAVLSPEDVREATERVIDIHLDTALREYAEKINEGNNGVIFRLNIQDIPKETQRLLQGDGLSLEGERAIKLLKIYRRGTGELEYTMQRRAHEIISGATDQREIARVPTPRYFRDLRITAETQAFLAACGMRSVGDRVEMLLMDLVPGEDMATIFYKEILRRNGVSKKDLAHMTVQQLAEEAWRFVGLRLPGGKHGRDVAQKIFEGEALKRENVERLIKYLRDRGFVLHPSILRQIERAMSVFHSSGFCFRDGHERNFMVDGGYLAEGEPGQVFIVDFGSSVTFEGDYESERDELYQPAIQGNRRYVDDDYIIEVLRPLVAPKTSKDQETIKAQEVYFVGLDRKRGRVLANPKIARLLEGRQNLEKIFALTIGVSPEETAADNFIIIVEELIGRDALTKEAVVDFIVSKIDDVGFAVRTKFEMLRRKLLE